VPGVLLERLILLLVSGVLLERLILLLVPGVLLERLILEFCKPRNFQTV
jgi:hypothetical protein